MTGKPGNQIPKELREALEQQKALLNPNISPETGVFPMGFYQSSNSTYRLNINQLHPEGNDGQPVWLLRLRPVEDPYTALHRKLQQADLTPREVEVALLAGDGLDDTEIAGRLFISSHTLKNHLKSIYRKLDVHSRTQLVAALRIPG